MSKGVDRMTHIVKVFLLIACLAASQQTYAQSAADEIYNRLVALQKQRDIYAALHMQAVSEGKTKLSPFTFGVPKETSEAISDEKNNLEDLAKQGNVRAMHLYGTVMYSYGTHLWNKPGLSEWNEDLIESSFKDAGKWFRSAANDGYPLSMYMLAVMHANGQGVLQSNYVAIEWYSKAGKAFLGINERDLALKSLEEINKLDSNHILAKELSGLLYGGPKGKSKPTAQ